MGAYQESWGFFVTHFFKMPDYSTEELLMFTISIGITMVKNYRKKKLR